MVEIPSLSLEELYLLLFALVCYLSNSLSPEKITVLSETDHTAVWINNDRIIDEYSLWNTDEITIVFNKLLKTHY